MYAIEKNIPLAKKTSVGSTLGRKSKYPFGKMNVSESFVVPANAPEAKVLDGSYTPRVASAAYAYGRKHGKKFSYRLDDKENVRVWRIA